MSNLLQKKKLLILMECLIWEKVTEEVLQHNFPAKARTRLPGKRNKNTKAQRNDSPVFKNSSDSKVI